MTRHSAFMNGHGNGVFGPDDNMTRGQAAQIFYNLLLNKDVEITVNFTDVSQDAWYAKAVNTLASLGIISGMGDGTFKPNEKITRAQTATIVNRMLARVCDRAFVNGEGVQRFNDVPSTHWAYYQIMEAANSHSHQYDADGYETWTGLNGEDSN